VEVIIGELKSFGAHLEDKPMLLVASKMDIANKEKLAKLRRYAKKHALELYSSSAATGEGVEALKLAMSRRLEELRQREAEALAK
jgi:GTP-binding protein